MRVFVSHKFRPSHHRGEINTLGWCHPSCLLFHPSLRFLRFILLLLLAKIKLALNWESMSCTCPAARMAALPSRMEGRCGGGHHLQVGLMQMRVQIFACSSPPYLGPLSINPTTPFLLPGSYSLQTRQTPLGSSLKWRPIHKSRGGTIL